MKRSLRIIFNALAALSLLLCIATTILWAGTRASGHTFLLCRTTGGSIRTMSFFQIWSAAGGVRVMIGRQRSDWGFLVPPPDPPTFAQGSYDFGPNPYPIDNSPRDQTSTAGPFQLSRLSEMQSNAGQQQLSITVPAWFLLALFDLPRRSCSAALADTPPKIAAAPPLDASSAATTSAPPPTAAPNATPSPPSHSSIPPPFSRPACPPCPKTLAIMQP